MGAEQGACAFYVDPGGLEPGSQLGDPPVGAVPRRELVVVEDGLVGHAQETEEEGGGDAGAVLARGAVEQRGELGGLGQAGEQGPEGGCGLGQHLPVDADNETGAVVVHLPGHDQLDDVGLLGGRLAHRAHHCTKAGAGRETAGRPPALEVPAEVVHDAQAEAGEEAQVGVGQLGQGVGAEHHPPAHPPAFHAAVAAEVAKVERALEGHEPLGGHDAGLALHAHVHVVAHAGVEAPQQHPVPVGQHRDGAGVVDGVGMLAQAHDDRALPVVARGGVLQGPADQQALGLALDLDVDHAGTVAGPAAPAAQR